VELLGTWSWSTWSELDGAARDVVDVVAVDVVGARRSCSGHGRRGSLSGSLGLMPSERLVLVDEFRSNLKSLLLLFV